MKLQCQKKLLVPREILSAQQKQIYELYKHGLSNKQIAVKLNLEQRSIATQLSRIRKKAAKLPLTYKIEPGAEHVQYSARQNSTAGELKKRIRDDPGFFQLMFNRYATNDGFPKENKYQLASIGQSSALLFSERAKRIKIMELSASYSRHDIFAVKIEKKVRLALKEYLHKQKISPIQTFWDDGSAIYLVTSRDLEQIQQLLSNNLNN